MKLFSDRLGATQSGLLGSAEMSEALRNSIWTVVSRYLFPEGDRFGRNRTLLLCEEFFRLPVDDLPYEQSNNVRWLRDQVLRGSSTWYDAYNLLEFLCRQGHRVFGTQGVEQFILSVNAVLERERSPYRVHGGHLVPVSSSESLQSISRAGQAADRYGLTNVSTHIDSALELLSLKPVPDIRNSIKESISAVEGLCKVLTGVQGGGLEPALRKLEESLSFHGGFRSALLSLYGYTSDEQGIRHAILEEKTLHLEDAIYMLVTCTALVDFVIAKAHRMGLLTGPRRPR